MSTKYKQKSADVLNEADRFQAVMEWQLFASAQEAQLYGYDGSKADRDWVPGIPLYYNPRDIVCLCEICIEEEQELINVPANYQGNVVRPMIELFVDGNEHYYMRCEPCGVSWRGGHVCWFCGTSYKPAQVKQMSYRTIRTHDSIVGDFGQVLSREYMDQLRAYMVVAFELPPRVIFVSNSTSRMQDYIREDVNLTRLLFDRWFVPVATAPTTPSVAFAIVREELRLPVWGIRAFYNRLDHTSSGCFMPVRVPPGWRSMRRDIPLPAMPELPAVKLRREAPRTGPIRRMDGSRQKLAL